MCASASQSGDWWPPKEIRKVAFWWKPKRKLLLAGSAGTPQVSCSNPVRGAKCSIEDTAALETEQGGLGRRWNEVVDGREESLVFKPPPPIRGRDRRVGDGDLGVDRAFVGSERGDVTLGSRVRVTDEAGGEVRGDVSGVVASAESRVGLVAGERKPGDEVGMAASLGGGRQAFKALDLG